MNKAELLGLKAHARIQYIGQDADILARLAKSKTAMKKGIVVVYAHDYTSSSWRTTDGITFSTWSHGQFTKVVPEDWVVIDDRRVDLERSREKRKIKRADDYVKSSLDNFSRELENLKNTKKWIDIRLDGIPLTARLKILTTLTEEQLMWFNLLSKAPKEIVAVMVKAFKDHEEKELEALEKPLAVEIVKPNESN